MALKRFVWSGVTTTTRFALPSSLVVHDGDREPL
jgi:hypothetical protein